MCVLLFFPILCCFEQLYDVVLYGLGVFCLLYESEVISGVTLMARCSPAEGGGVPFDLIKPLNPPGQQGRKQSTAKVVKNIYIYIFT